jgi:hypothetical protein
MEGSLERTNNEYRFRFRTNQIKDMRELIKDVTGKDSDKMVISINSKELFKSLNSLGFEVFGSRDWNVPPLESYTQTQRNEYLRAVIDSLGNVDVEESVPVIRLTSVNILGLSAIAFLFGARSTWSGRDSRYRAYWKGQNAIDILDELGWSFNNPRNQRGAQLISAVRWEDYLV